MSVWAILWTLVLFGGWIPVGALVWLVTSAYVQLEDWWKFRWTVVDDGEVVYVTYGVCTRVRMRGGKSYLLIPRQTDIDLELGERVRILAQQGKWYRLERLSASPSPA